MNRKYILIVEDSPTQAARTQYILEAEGYEVHVAVDGVNALEMIIQREPDMIISDIVMPRGIDGYQLCAKIKSNQNLKQIPVILLTSLSATSDILKGAEAGADNFIVKPFDDAYLLSRVSQLFSNQFAKGAAQPVENSETIVFNTGGESHQISSDKNKIMNLLVSSYATAVEKNNEVSELKQKLKLTQDKIAHIIQKKNIELTNEDVYLRQNLEALESLVGDIASTDYSKRETFSNFTTEEFAKKVKQSLILIQRNIGSIKKITTELMQLLHKV